MALGPYITDDDLKDAVAAALGVSPSSALPAIWDDLIPNANTSATNDIATALMGKGYTSSQVASWDEVESYARDLGTFWALTRGAGLGNYSAPLLKSLDRREELKLLAFIIIDGEAVAPAVPNAAAVGGISSGTNTTGATTLCDYRKMVNGYAGTGWGGYPRGCC